MGKTRPTENADRLASPGIPGIEDFTKPINSADYSIMLEKRDTRDRSRAEVVPKSAINGSSFTIAAIIPLYNGERWITQSLQSVLEQTRPPDEIIVVDDGSTDQGSAIVKRIAQSYPVRLLGQRNCGQSSARNFGVAQCRSMLIAFLDQDDSWYPRHLEELEKCFKRTKDVGWVYSNLDEIDEHGMMVCKSFLNTRDSPQPKRSIYDCLRSDMFILPSASLISKHAFESVGGFDERLSGYEDDDFFLRLFRAGYDSLYINKPLSKWRIYTTSSSYTSRMARSRMAYAAKLLAEFPDNLEQARFFGRDVIVPRFIRNVLGDIRKALLIKDKNIYRQGICDLKLLINHMQPTHRIYWRVVLALGSRYAVTRAMRHTIRCLYVVRTVLAMFVHPLRSARTIFFGQ